MRRMIEAAELKNQRTVAPEAHQMHLTPETDPASTFRLRRCLLTLTLVPKPLYRPSFDPPPAQVPGCAAEARPAPFERF